MASLRDSVYHKRQCPLGGPCLGGSCYVKLDPDNFTRSIHCEAEHASLFDRFKCMEQPGPQIVGEI
jgi:hypothetical protein